MTTFITSHLLKKYPNWDISIALRYLPIVSQIDNTYSPADKILEVGSGEFGVLPYLNKYHDLTGVDLDFGQKRLAKIKRVQSSADKLPFKNSSFKSIISVDTLEHIKPLSRKKVVFEMIRVAQSQVFLAFPRGYLSELTDKAIDKYYQFTHKNRLNFLQEQISYRLPREAEVDAWVREAANKYNKVVTLKKHGNTNLLFWLAMLLLGFSEVRFLTSIYHKLLLLLPILKHFNIPPTYRVLMFVNLKNV